MWLRSLRRKWRISGGLVVMAALVRRRSGRIDGGLLGLTDFVPGDLTMRGSQGPGSSHVFCWGVGGEEGIIGLAWLFLTGMRSIFEVCPLANGEVLPQSS